MMNHEKLDENFTIDLIKEDLSISDFYIKRLLSPIKKLNCLKLFVLLIPLFFIVYKPVIKPVVSFSFLSFINNRDVAGDSANAESPINIVPTNIEKQCPDLKPVNLYIKE